MSDQDQDAAITQWLSFTGGPSEDARHYLEANGWNVESAVDMWFGDQAENQDDAMDEQDDDEEDEPIQSSGKSAASGSAVPTGGGRTLAGGPAPAQSSSSSKANPSQGGRAKPKGGLHTLGDISSGGRGGGGHGHAHDDDDEDEGHHKQDFFAGGEKSGLAVQNPGNPRDMLDRMFQRAQENAPRPGGDDEEEQASHFSGRGQTLGGDDAPSRVVEEPRANQDRRLPRVTRTLHVWQNGFSIDDGPLRDPRTDPENARILQMIMGGHAPLHLLNVEPGQEVDLNLDNRRDEDYVQPKGKFVAFGGTGQRLGEAGPSVDASSTSATTSAPQASSSTTGSASRASGAAEVSIDSSQPTVNLQIRLGDGTRLQSRFNTTHTIGDVYAFVTASSPASQSRTFVLSSTFPPKDFEDKSAVLGDLPEFKRGGVVVQKWK